MGKSMKQLVLLAKKHVDNTDPVPTGGANAILARGISPQPIAGDFVERSLVLGYKGNFGSLLAGVHRIFEFECELAGSGDAGTPPPIGPLLECCGMVEDITADTDVTYTTGAAEPRLAIYCYLDGIRWKLLNGKGTVSFDFSAKGIPVAKFKFLGEYSSATDTPLPVDADFSTFLQPLTVGKVNTPTFTAFGLTACMNSFSVDIANTLIWRELVNCSGAANPDRKPTASMVIELPTTAQKDWAEVTRLGTTGPLQIVHGTQAGNIVQLDAPKAQGNTAPSLSDQDGIAMANLGFALLPDAGNDELVLTFK